MTIETELDDELKDALRAKDRARLDVIRQIRTEVAKAASETGGRDQDREALHEKIIAAYVKKMDKARREYEGYGDRAAEMTAKLAFEIDYLSRWITEAASSDEVDSIVAEAIAAVGATDPKQTGQIIGHIMKNHKGLDGGAVNQAVRAALGG
jgi:uncharacterized protein YqeY